MLLQGLTYKHVTLTNQLMHIVEGRLLYQVGGWCWGMCLGRARAQGFSAHESLLMGC